MTTASGTSLLTRPGVSTLPTALRAAAEEFGEHPAIVDGDRTFSFAALHAEVTTTARAYAALGVQPGDRVCLWAPNGWEWEVAALAVSYAGATLVPLNTRYKGHEVVDIAARTRARVLVVADGFLDREQVAELRAAAREEYPDAPPQGPVPGLPDVRAVLRIGEGDGPDGVTAFAERGRLAEQVPAGDVEARAEAVTSDDVADIMFTSGTTGRPKGVLTAHRQTLEAARAWAATTGVTDHDRYLIINPYFHTFGYKAGWVVCLLTGATTYPMATFDLDETLRLIDQERISVLPGSPTIYQSIFNSSRLARTDTSSLRVVVTGATIVPVALVERLQSELSVDQIHQAFGQTECVVATMTRRGDPDELVAASVGKAVEGLELRIADPETGEVRAPGEEGELQLRGDQVMLGYLDDEESTREALEPDGWLHTGDVARADENGYVTITDRLKDMYICGGFNVYPAEVEQALARMGELVETAVVGIPDERMGEVGRAYVVRTPDATVTEQDVIDFARERVANFKVPREVVFADTLPRNLSGKVLKNELRSAP